MARQASQTRSAPRAERSEPAQEVQTAEQAVENLPAVVSVNDGDEFGTHAGAGLENVTASDMLVPRLTILQQLSPQLNNRKAEYLEGATQGQICDVGIGDFWDSIHFVPCYFEKVWLEWAPRSSGRGLVAIHSDPAILDKCTLNEKNQPFNGPNLVAATTQIYGFNLTAGGRRSFISLASTQLRTSRKWMALATGEKLQRSDGTEYTPPLFYRSYLLDSTMTTNAEGDWSLLRVSRAETLPELAAPGGPFPNLNWRNLKQDCILFIDSLRKGQVKADTSSLGEEMRTDAPDMGDHQRNDGPPKTGGRM
jgi:hypothetical protein